MSNQVMKLNGKTLQILKNFASINQSILFKPGKTLSTISPTKTIMARATIESEIESTFAIYELPKFLSALSLFNDPELVINEKFVSIKSGSKNLNYTFADPSLIVSPPDKEIKLPSLDVEFILTQQTLSDVLKAAGVLSLPEISVVGRNGVISIRASDSKNPSGDVYSIDVGETEKTFTAVFKVENIKIISGDYDVKISSRGISRFIGTDVEYFIAIEQSSVF